LWLEALDGDPAGFFATGGETPGRGPSPLWRRRRLAPLPCPGGVLRDSWPCICPLLGEAPLATGAPKKRPNEKKKKSFDEQRAKESSLLSRRNLYTRASPRPKGTRISCTTWAALETQRTEYGRRVTTSSYQLRIGRCAPPPLAREQPGGVQYDDHAGQRHRSSFKRLRGRPPFPLTRVFARFSTISA